MTDRAATLAAEQSIAQQLGIQLTVSPYHAYVRLDLCCSECDKRYHGSGDGFAIYGGMVKELAYRAQEDDDWWFGKSGKRLCRECFLEEVERVAEEIERDLVESNELAEERAA